MCACSSVSIWLSLAGLEASRAWTLEPMHSLFVCLLWLGHVNTSSSSSPLHSSDAPAAVAVSCPSSGLRRGRPADHQTLPPPPTTPGMLCCMRFFCSKSDIQHSSSLLLRCFNMKLPSHNHSILRPHRNILCSCRQLIVTLLDFMDCHSTPAKQ